MRNRSLMLPVRLSRVALGAGLVLAGIAASSSASAQTLGGAFPFPSTNLAAGRIKTDAITSFEIEDFYREWHADTIVDCGNDMTMVYPENNPPDTRSEGIGYGMVISAYMGDAETFAGLWNYYQRTSTGGLMNWQRNGCPGQDMGAGSNGSAADADIDAALGLIVGEKQFPGQGYGQDAVTILNAIRTRLVNVGGRACDGILLPGSNYSGCGCVNPSYIPPGYYSAYAVADQTQAAAWNGARDTSYTFLNAAANPTTGFVPAWSNSTGGTQLQNCDFQVAGGGGPDEYQSDAARTPWRVATDFAWTGDPRAQQFLQRMVGFVTTLPRVRIVDRYSLQGQGLGDNVASALTRRGSFHMGGFATAMMASTQENLDSFTGAWHSVYRAGDFFDTDTLRAYNSSLAMLYALLVTGTMWNPAAANPTPIQEPTLPAQGTNLLANGDFTAGIRGWTTQSLSNPDTGDDSDGYAVHKAGEIHMHVLKVQAAHEYGIQFYQDVSLQAGQNYQVSLRARADVPRPMRVNVGEVLDFDNNGDDYESYGVLTDGEGDTFALSTTDATYSFVFTAPITNPTARLNLHFGDVTGEVIFDDVSVTPTTLPPTEVVQVEGGTPPVDPGTPAPGTGGDPTAQPGDSDLGTVTPPPGDNTGNPGVPGATPGDQTAGSPPAPVGAPGASSCTAQTTTACAPYACSVPLSLCYDQNTGYVWDPSRNAWTQPPSGVAGCAVGQVFWPKFNLCYVPNTGWIYNTTTLKWEWYGIDYTEGKRPPADDSGCTVSGVPAGNGGSSWLLAGFLAAGVGLASRRRRSA